MLVGVDLKSVVRTVITQFAVQRQKKYIASNQII